MSATKLRLAILLVCCALAVPASAGTLTLVTDRAAFSGYDTVRWGSLGGDLTSLGGSATTTSDNGVGVNVTVTGTDSLLLVSGSTYNADFLPTDTALYVDSINQGAPLTLLFDRPIQGAGAQVQSNAYGSFIAYLSALDRFGNLLAPPVSITGGTVGNGDGSAPFLGILSSEQDIYGLQFSVFDIGADGQLAENSLGYAINDVSIVPEPATLLLVGTGVLGAIRRRTRK